MTDLDLNKLRKMSKRVLFTVLDARNAALYCRNGGGTEADRQQLLSLCAASLRDMQELHNEITAWYEALKGDDK